MCVDVPRVVRDSCASQRSVIEAVRVRRVSTATAIVVIDADALTVGLPAEVAVTVDVLDVPSAAVAGAATLTQTSCVAPAARLAVAVIEVVQVESKKLVAKVPPDDVRL